MKFHKRSLLVTMELLYAYYLLHPYGNRVHHDKENGVTSKKLNERTHDEDCSSCGKW